MSSPMNDEEVSGMQTFVPHLPASATGARATGRPLAGRRILVVGGGQQTYGQEDPPTGIGRAISVLAAREGAGVAVADLDVAAAHATVAIVCAEGGTAAALAADASDEAAMASLADAAARELGGLDGLVMNLGVPGGHGLAGTSAAEWDRVMATNVRSHFLGCKHVLPLLPPGGAIVLISSTAALLPSTMEIPAYAASKAALDGLCRYAAREAGARRVRVNVVMAGLIDTSLGRLATLVKPDRATTPIPLGRQGTGWEVAEAVIYLLSDRASYITGQTLVVDGGLSGAA